jgi:hypothetical protein
LATELGINTPLDGTITNSVYLNWYAIVLELGLKIVNEKLDV